ncbi:MAG: hypothetical protein AB7S70_15360 [Hyphomicrobium sp.]|uniref:hypothetical protein n=1 Tax=Hyphomicrobium sp. TaxID=82 RepID=UPI003D0C5D85
MRLLPFLLLLLAFALPSEAGQPDVSQDESAIRAVLDRWYGELRPDGGRKQWQLYAPGAIDGGPGERELFPDRRSRSPTVSNELAAQALRFGYDVDLLTIDARLAKAVVWERGYFYAWAAETTYERAASAVFVLEKQEDGRWLILAHEAASVGIPPNKVTSPLPDMREHVRKPPAPLDSFRLNLTMPPSP